MNSNQEKDILIHLLKKIRLKANLRQEDVAKRLNKPQSFVSKYESGERRLDLLELRKICFALDTSLEDFVKLLEKELT